MGTGWLIKITNAPKHFASDELNIEMSTPAAGKILELNVQKKDGGWECSAFEVLEILTVDTQKNECTVKYLYVIIPECSTIY